MRTGSPAEYQADANASLRYLHSAEDPLGQIAAHISQAQNEELSTHLRIALSAPRMVGTPTGGSFSEALEPWPRNPQPRHPSSYNGAAGTRS